ncbi:MAG: hypothetical protein ACK4FV_06760 [Candidatus Nitrosocaldus sp.]
MNLHSKKGIASIVGNMLMLILLFTSFATIFTFIKYQQTAIEVQKSLSKHIDLSIISEIVGCPAPNSRSYCITVGIINKSNENINILSIWIIDKYGKPILQRDINTTLEKYRSKILLDSHQLNSNNVGDKLNVKVVLSDGTIKVKEINNIPYHILKIKLLPITTNCQGPSSELLVHVANNEDTPITDVKVYINDNIVDIGRLEGKEDVILQEGIIGLNRTITVYAEGSILGRTVRSNSETIRCGIL